MISVTKVWVTEYKLYVIKYYNNSETIRLISVQKCFKKILLSSWKVAYQNLLWKKKLKKTDKLPLSDKCSSTEISTYFHNLEGSKVTRLRDCFSFQCNILNLSIFLSFYSKHIPILHQIHQQENTRDRCYYCSLNYDTKIIWPLFFVLMKTENTGLHN